MAKRRNEAAHTEMVKILADHLVRKGHSDVKADHDAALHRPKTFYWKGKSEGHRPDVTSSNGSDYIFEVETADSIDEQHTEDQWKLFAAVAREHSKLFIVVVPKVGENAARARARTLEISLHDVWTIG